jgi:hypothetical protein
MPPPAEITAFRRAHLVGALDNPVPSDVQIRKDFAAGPHSIRNAFRHGIAALHPLFRTFAGCRVVVYRQQDREMFQGVAAILRADGCSREVLKGGQLARCASGHPMTEAISTSPAKAARDRHPGVVMRLPLRPLP